MKIPVFHTVWYFNHGTEDFEMLWVSSVESEAKAFADQFDADNSSPELAPTCKAVVLGMTLDRIKQNLVEGRLGVLHDSLIRLEKLVADANQPSKVSMHVLVGGSGLPVAAVSDLLNRVSSR